MEKILKLYTFVDGVNDAPFPNIGEQISISSFRYEAKRMGAAPTISCTIEHTSCLDNIWTKDVYVNFRGEKYYLKQIPTSSYSNNSILYKHEVEFVSERSILDNVYFYDVVNEDEKVDRVVSNSTSFSFSGDIHEFVTRLNESLTRLNVGYSIVIDSGISSEVKLVEFDNKFITEALQEISNTYNLKYYFIGKVIHVGLQQNIISKVFKYGDKESLLSISKNNANAKIINRITGTGSSDNIPFYYPNDDEKGVTEVLLNGSPNGAKIVDAVKYRRVKSTDTFIFKGNAEYSVDLIGGAKRVLGNVSFIGDPEAQKNGYEVDFYYQIELETGENVRISITSSHNETRNLSYELIKTNGVNYGVNTSENIFSLSRGTYNIIVRWRFLVDEPFRFEEEAFDLIDEYVKVDAEIVVASNNVWTLNNIPVNLESYGISSVSAQDGDRITVNRLLYIHPQKSLMPSIYRIEEGRERFYNAENNKYKDEDGEYYEFENIYSSRHPKEHIETFDDIKPSIKNIKNIHGQDIDEFIDFAYDTNDNDDVDENNEFIHPYFYAKLRRFNGEYGFNLFDHAIESNEMVISMVSGSCASCEFPIMVDTNTQKNKVLVDDNGNLLRDANGNVRMGNPIDRQNNTIDNEVWIALKKDINTYGVIMPNATNKYRPSTEDKFVILHIDLPKVYVTQAEKKLEEELIKYMHDNNYEKFNFSISFSRIFFAENPSILNNLNENSKITIEYNGQKHSLYVSSFSYSVEAGSTLPEVKVELSDALVIQQNQINQIVSATKKDILAKTSSNTTESDIKRMSTVFEAEIQSIKDEVYKPRPEVFQPSGGTAESVDWDNIQGKPNWIGNSKPTYNTDEVEEGDSNLYFTNERAVAALTSTLAKYVTLAGNQTISGVKTFTNGFKVGNGTWVVKIANSKLTLGTSSAYISVDSKGNLETIGGATVNGNLLVKGGLTFYSTNGTATPFLIDATSSSGITSTSTTQVYTARAVTQLKTNLQNQIDDASEAADDANARLDEIKSALASITSSSTLADIRSALLSIKNNI